MNRISNLISGIYLMLVRKYYTGSASNHILTSWISKQKKYHNKYPTNKLI